MSNKPLHFQAKIFQNCYLYYHVNKLKIKTLIHIEYY